MEPITLKPGEQITKDGIYIIPAERYHHDAELCDGPSISSTGLRQISVCPATYWAHSPYNPNRREPKPKDVFAIGKAAHSIILEGVLPDREFAVSPYPEFRTNEAKAWKADREAKGMTILKEKDLDAIEDMRKSLAADPMIKAGLFQGLVECSVIWKDKATGIWLKSRPDVIPNDDTYADAKFVKEASPRALMMSLVQYRYHMQFALGVEGIKVVLKRDIQNCAMVGCEKIYPHVVTVAVLDDASLVWGHRLNRLSIDEFAERLKSGDWPGYEQGPVTIGLPKFEIDRLERAGAVIPEIDEQDMEDDDDE